MAESDYIFTSIWKVRKWTNVVWDVSEWPGTFMAWAKCGMIRLTLECSLAKYKHQLENNITTSAGSPPQLPSELPPSGPS